jgi:copper chaperone CopZ
MAGKEMRFQVRGMKCDGCIARAREALGRLPGFEGAEFDLKAGAAVVRGAVDAEEVVHVLTKLGYPASKA